MKDKFNIPSFNFDFFDFNSKKNILFAICGILFVWLLSGIYAIDEGEEAAIIRFGRFVRYGSAGLNYHFPFPIEKVLIEKVNQSKRIEIGYRSVGAKNSETISAESIMVTGDENIVNLSCDVMWHIKDLSHYLFNVFQPEDTVKVVAETSIREIIAKTPIASVLSSQKQEISDKIEELMQKTLDQYESGIQIEKVQLLKAEPPADVIDSYRDVQTARADKEREINQAQSYSNDILPKTRGESTQILQAAEAYKREVIARAEGDTSRFNAVLSQYSQAKQITKDRLYLDTITEVLKDANKIIVGTQALPYFQLFQQQNKNK